MSIAVRTARPSSRCFARGPGNPSSCRFRATTRPCFSDFLDGRISDREWLDWGGAATALSYGVNPSKEAILSAALSRAVPLDDVRFLRALRPSFRYGPYFFAHAGVLPDRPLDEQVPDDLLWIRKPFLDHAGPFGAVVVHGHTPNAEPEFKPNRINLDTGAYATHRLSCLRIDCGRRGADRQLTAADGTRSAKTDRTTIYIARPRMACPFQDAH